MPARKALTADLEYLVARHPQHGLILYDASRHDDPALATHLVYCFPINAEIPVQRASVWEGCSDDIARVDFLNIVHCYNNFRVLRLGPAQTHRVALKIERVLAKPASPSTLFDSTVETLSGWRPR